MPTGILETGSDEGRTSRRKCCISCCVCSAMCRARKKVDPISGYLLRGLFASPTHSYRGLMRSLSFAFLFVHVHLVRHRVLGATPSRLGKKSFNWTMEFRSFWRARKSCHLLSMPRSCETLIDAIENEGMVSVATDAYFLPGSGDQLVTVVVAFMFELSLELHDRQPGLQEVYSDGIGVIP